VIQLPDARLCVVAGLASGRNQRAVTYIKSSTPPRLHRLDLPDIIPPFAAHAGLFLKSQGQGVAQ